MRSMYLFCFFLVITFSFSSCKPNGNINFPGANRIKESDYSFNFKTRIIGTLNEQLLYKAKLNKSPLLSEFQTAMTEIKTNKWSLILFPESFNKIIYVSNTDNKIISIYNRYGSSLSAFGHFALGFIEYTGAKGKCELWIVKDEGNTTNRLIFIDYSFQDIIRVSNITANILQLETCYDYKRQGGWMEFTPMEASY